MCLCSVYMINIRLTAEDRDYMDKSGWMQTTQQYSSLMLSYFLCVQKQTRSLYRTHSDECTKYLWISTSSSFRYVEFANACFNTYKHKIYVGILNPFIHHGIYVLADRKNFQCIVCYFCMSFPGYVKVANNNNNHQKMFSF